MRWHCALGWIGFVLATLAVLCGPVPASAQTGQNIEMGHRPIFADSCLLVSKSPLSFAEARAASGWNCAPDIPTADDHSVWLRFDPKGTLSGELSLTGVSAPLQRIHVVIETNGGEIRSRQYSAQDIASHWTPGNYYALPLAVPGEKITRLNIGIARPQTELISTELGLAQTRWIADQRLRNSIMFALSIGMMLIVALLSAVMFAAVRYRVAAFHAVFTFVLAIYVTSASSLIYLLLPELGLWWRAFISFTSLALGGSLIGPIILHYFERSLITPTLRKLVIGSATLALAAVLVLPLGSVIEMPTRAVYHILFLPGCLTVFATIIIMHRRGSRRIKSFTLAWLPLVIFGFERVLRGSGLYYLPNWMEYLLFIGLAMQAVAMTVAIALQAEAIRRDRDQERFRAEQAREEALHDGLTGLPNRRDFDRWQSRAEDYLAILDLDHFKQVNDRFGHDAGDAALKATGAALMEAQESGLVLRAWRLGGEEFAIALNGTGIEEAALKANRARLSISSEIETHLGKAIGQVTASAGLARNGDQPRQAFRAADSALYQAKAGGRDRLCFIGERNETTTIFPARAAATAA